MANVHFMKMLATDELRETLFYATGEQVLKEKEGKFNILTAGRYKVQIEHNKNIVVNGRKLKSIVSAKWLIQETIDDEGFKYE